MNSLYSTIENQQLLWEMINKTPLITVHFPPNLSESIPNKEKWFLSILNEFHQKNPYIYKKDDLLQMNRSTLSCLMNDLKNKNTNTNNTNTNNINTNNINTNNTNNTNNQIDTDLNSRYTRIEPRSNSYTNSYEERQKEYESMLHGVLPTPVQFEKIEDKKIQNITELTEQYRKSRELDMPITPIMENTTNIKLTLHEPLHEKDVIDVLNVIDVVKTNAEKHIHWADSFTEISNLHEQIKLLKSRMDDFDRQIKEIQIPLQHYVKIDSSTQVDAIQIDNINDIDNVVERIQKIAFENTENE